MEIGKREKKKGKGKISREGLKSVYRMRDETTEWKVAGTGREEEETEEAEGAKLNLKRPGLGSNTINKK